MTNEAAKITAQSLALFLAYANDAGNWSGCPLVGGNVGSEPADKGPRRRIQRPRGRRACDPVSRVFNGEAEAMKIEWARNEGSRWVVECRTASGSLVEYCAKTLPAALALAYRYGATL